MLFDQLVDKYSENYALITDKGEKVKYADLDILTAQLIVDIGKRSLVFCLCDNNVESLSGYFSFIKNDIVPLMLDSTVDSNLLQGLIEKYHPEYIWSPTDKINQFYNSNVIFSFENYSLIRIKGNASPRLNDDLALLLTTSGSTGSPKLVRISYDNLEANANSIAEYLSIDKNERPITALPMSYTFGLSIINSHLIKGAAILLTSKSLMEKEFWTFLKEEKATSLSGVPYTFEMLKKLRFFNMNLEHLKTMTQAGGKMNDELNHKFSEFCNKSGINFFVMYGQTEATARMSYLPAKYSLSKLGSMGIAIPGGRFYLVDDNGETIVENEAVGELVYEGKNVSMGYAISREDLIRGDENNRVLITGDLAKRDAEGFYYIVGRKKRFIKLFGNRINLDETERLIKNITANVACTGLDDKMVIYITDEELISKVKSFIVEKTKINQKAFKVALIDLIPINSSGKTIYSELPKI
jgi:acyl-CoA synthetase (AMP-forming)/AMP-acid ligase II